MTMNPRMIDPKTRQIIVTKLVPSLATQLLGLTIYTDQFYYTNNEYTASQTLDGDNSLVLVNTSGHVTITLPAASTTHAGYTIKNIGTGQVSIDPNGSDTIDGETGLELYTQYEYVTIVSDGTEWFIIGGEFVKMTETLTNIKSELEKMNENQAKIAWLLGHIRDAELDSTEADLDEFEKEMQDLMVDIDG